MKKNYNLGVSLKLVSEHGFNAFQHIGHMEEESLFKVSSDRPEKLEIEHASPGLVD